MAKMIQCKTCSNEISSNAKFCPGCGAKNKKPIYKRGWFIVVVFFVIIGILGSNGSNNSSSNTTSTQTLTQGEQTETAVSTEEKVPAEYTSALKKAQIYSDTMSMSKTALYDQLTSDYGEKFPQEAAQYAIDNVQADWKENALKKAQTYQKEMAMSSSAIYDQLTSDYGEKFTQDEAQYAIDNLNN